MPTIRENKKKAAEKISQLLIEQPGQTWEVLTVIMDELKVPTIGRGGFARRCEAKKVGDLWYHKDYNIPAIQVPIASPAPDNQDGVLVTSVDYIDLDGFRHTVHRNGQRFKITLTPIRNFVLFLTCGGGILALANSVLHIF